MRIRIGQLLNKVSTIKDRVPSNFSMSDHAEQEINYTVNVANAAYEQALATDGVEFMLFRKTREGRPCTCKISATQNNVEPDSRFEEYNEVTPLTESSGSTIRVRGSWDKLKTRSNVHGKELGVDVGLIEPDDGSTKQFVKKYDKVEKRDVDDLLSGPIDFRLLQSGDATTACGICLGSGFTNGYSLYKGARTTFDYTSTSHISKFTIDRDSRPYLFKTSGEDQGQYIEFDWETPNNFIATLAITIRNNLKPANQFTVLVKWDDNIGFVLFTKELLNSFEGDSRRVKIRVVPDRPRTETITFSHLEVIVQYSEFDKTQVPSFQANGSGVGPAGNVSTIELNLPPRIDNVGTGDVIMEMKYNNIFVLTDVTDLQTASKRNLNWTVNGRRLSAMEPLSLLKVSKFDNYSVAYTGLQGDFD